MEEEVHVEIAERVIGKELRELVFFLDSYISNTSPSGQLRLKSLRESLLNILRFLDSGS